MNLIARFLPNLVPGLGALFNPWTLLAIIVLAAMSAIGGARVESWHRDAQALTQANAGAEAYRQGIKARIGDAQAVSATIRQQEAVRETKSTEFAVALNDARRSGALAGCARTTFAASTPPPALDRVPLAQTDAVPVVANDGRVMLTGDFVRLYNLAIGVTEPARDRPGRTPDDRARPHTVALRLEWCFAGGCVGESRTEREAMVRAPNAVTRLAGLGAA